MNNTYKSTSIKYVNHTLNSSPTKSAYSFTKQIRFKMDTSLNIKDNKKDSSNNPINQSNTNQQSSNNKQSSDLAQTNILVTKQGQNKDQTQHRKDYYFGYESKSKKKDDYTILPVRRDIDQIVQQMQELRFLFKSSFKKKKFLDKKKKQANNNKKINNFIAYKVQRDILNHTNKSVTPKRSKSALDTDRFGRRKSDANRDNKLYDSNLTDLQNNRKRSISSFGNYVQSHLCNSSSFSFPTSPRNIIGIKNNQKQRRFDFYAPFSQFGQIRHRQNQAQ